MSVRFQFDFERALAAMVYIASKLREGADSYQMCKLIFLSDKLHLVRFGRPITGDDVRAMRYGPVPSAVYDILTGALEDEANERVHALAHHLRIELTHRYPRFVLSQTMDFQQDLSSSEMAAMDEVIARHANKSFGELYDFTHAMPSYKAAWEDPNRTSQNPQMSFEKLFENDQDADAEVKEEMIEDYEIRQALYAGV